MNADRRDLSRVFPLLDAAMLVVAGLLAYWLRWQHLPPRPDYSLALVLGGLLALVLLPATGAYRSWRGRDHSLQAGNALPGLAATFLALVVIAAFSKTTADYSRLWMGYWVLAATLLLFLARLLLSKLPALASAGAPRILIIGTDRLAAATVERLREAYRDPAVVVGLLHPGDDPVPEGLPAPVLGRTGDLDRYLQGEAAGIDEIWLASSHLPEASRAALVARLQASCLTVRFVPDLSLLDLLGHMPREVAGMTVIELNATPLTGSAALIKGGFDRLGAVALLLLLSPLLLLVAAAIRLDSPGPVLFRQKRHGGLGNVIEVYKFRTMRHEPGAGYRQATRGDPRVTRLGSFLRRASIDELPQLFNVLRGDMSLVGPRPHPVELNRDFADKIDAYMQRHRVKPGITGWAQVNGFRGETDTLEKMAERVAHDLYYIENWSLWLDIRILLMTLFSAWSGRNAY